MAMEVYMVLRATLAALLSRPDVTRLAALDAAETLRGYGIDPVTLLNAGGDISRRMVLGGLVEGLRAMGAPHIAAVLEAAPCEAPAPAPAPAPASDPDIASDVWFLMDALRTLAAMLGVLGGESTRSEQARRLAARLESAWDSELDANNYTRSGNPASAQALDEAQAALTGLLAPLADATESTAGRNHIRMFTSESHPRKPMYDGRGAPSTGRHSSGLVWVVPAVSAESARRAIRAGKYLPALADGRKVDWARLKGLAR